MQLLNCNLNVKSKSCSRHSHCRTDQCETISNCRKVSVFMFVLTALGRVLHMHGVHFGKLHTADFWWCIWSGVDVSVSTWTCRYQSINRSTDQSTDHASITQETRCTHSYHDFENTSDFLRHDEDRRARVVEMWQQRPKASRAIGIWEMQQSL